MLFTYKVINPEGKQKKGTIEAVSPDFAVTSLQRRGFVVVSVTETEEKTSLLYRLPFFDKVPLKDVVMMSRQLSTLFEAQVSAVKTFDLMAGNLENKYLATTLRSVTQDIQGGITISEAMRKQPEVFSNFYVNMVAAGEETGHLTDTFRFLADYLERNYELSSKTKNALIYPAFVVLTFFIVMILMMTLVIPRLAEVIEESEQEIPLFTKIVIGSSQFLVEYGVFLLGGFIALVVYVAYSLRQETTKRKLDELKLKVPYFKKLFNRLYLSRIADNLQTMLSAGIPVVKALEITSTVIGNRVFEDILNDSVNKVKAGSMVSDALAQYEDIPEILVQMMRIGEESGSLTFILGTLAKFYKREVDTAVDTLIGLIEPAMIIGLGVSVGGLLSSILLPIYNIAGGIS